MVGYELFRDVNSHATAFGELVESRRHTPSLPVEEVAVNRPFNCGSSSSHFLTFLLPTRHGGSACPSELVGVAETGRAPVGDAIASHTVI